MVQGEDGRDFHLAACLLVQVDIENHSRWFATPGSVFEKARARADLANRINEIIRIHQLEELTWNGDGGVYFRNVGETEVENFDFSIDVASSIMRIFYRWRSMSDDRKIMDIRCSIHYTADIYIHKNRSYWASVDLNDFMKHERKIAVAGTIAITNKVWPNLSGSRQNDFKHSLERPLGQNINKIYYTQQPAGTSSASFGFFEWMSYNELPLGNSDDIAFGPKSAYRMSIGDACVLFAAAHPAAALSIDMMNLPHESVPAPAVSDRTDLLTPEEIDDWKRRREFEIQSVRNKLREDGKKVSVFRIVRPFSDNPLATFFCQTAQWSDVRAFHKLLEDNQATRRRLAQRALSISEEGSTIPSITCCHMIVRTTDKHNGARGVLACQRTPPRAVPPSTYYGGRWSISIEEQMRPNEGVEECCSRGVGEELLGIQGTIGDLCGTRLVRADCREV
jgi:hypothetical protein